MEHTLTVLKVTTWILVCRGLTIHTHTHTHTYIYTYNKYIYGYTEIHVHHAYISQYTHVCNFSKSPAPPSALLHPCHLCSLPPFPTPKPLGVFWTLCFPISAQSWLHPGRVLGGQNYGAIISHIIQKGNNREFKTLNCSVFCRTEFGTCKFSAWSSCGIKRHK